MNVRNADSNFLIWMHCVAAVIVLPVQDVKFIFVRHVIQKWS